LIRISSGPPFGLLADLVLVAHATFVLFVLAGGLLVARWPRLAWIHLPAVAWGAAVEFAGLTCPLTPLEQVWRRASGSGGYEGDFIEHYVTAALYPTGLTRMIQVGLGLLVLVLNLWVYWRLLTRRDQGLHDSRRSRPGV
jgi:Protein of Unknown function (DUF2784)